MMERKYFNNSRRPFTLTLAGEKVYVVTSASDVADVNRNDLHLTFDQYIKDMMVAFGGTQYSITKMWQMQVDETMVSNSDGHKNAQRSLAHIAEDCIRRQLLPGSSGHLYEVQDKLLSTLHQNLVMAKAPSPILHQERARTQRQVSLLEWTRSSLLEGATNAFFGPKLQDLEPNLFQSFFEFDELSWKLTYKIPAPWSNDMNAAKATAQKAIANYFRLPREERLEGCWLFATLEDKMKAQGIDEEDIAAYVTMIYWV
ncbi:MAG: hypothetical protein Q9165_007290 [Trypethelium subeluteriae]